VLRRERGPPARGADYFGAPSSPGAPGAVFSGAACRCGLQRPGVQSLLWAFALGQRLLGGGHGLGFKVSWGHGPGFKFSCVSKYPGGLGLGRAGPIFLGVPHVRHQGHDQSGGRHIEWTPDVSAQGLLGVPRQAGRVSGHGVRDGTSDGAGTRCPEDQRGCRWRPDRPEGTGHGENVPELPTGHGGNVPELP
jgi:hypothetical protein